MDHDQFFKKLLTRFFEDLVRIVAPEVAPDLRLDEVTFLESEGFTDFRDGSRRLLDLVAQVETLRGEPEIVLVHVEIEGQARKSMELRMWRYAMQLRLRHGRPVIPIVLYLRGGPPGVSARTRRRALWRAVPGQLRLSRLRALRERRAGPSTESPVRRGWTTRRDSCSRSVWRITYN